jgi:tetratricopeptide (TPR) repeat protein
LEIEKIKSNINIKSPVNDYLKIAHLYAQIDEFDNSINYIYRALAIEPQNSRAYYILAMVYEKKKDYKNAIDSWQKCFQYSNNKEIKEIAQKHIDYLSQMK